MVPPKAQWAPPRGINWRREAPQKYSYTNQNITLNQDIFRHIPQSPWGPCREPPRDGTIEERFVAQRPASLVTIDNYDTFGQTQAFGQVVPQLFGLTRNGSYRAGILALFGENGLAKTRLFPLEG
jgi:hypothetical protein